MTKIGTMKATTFVVLAETAEQTRVLEAFLKALNIKFIPTKPNLEELEARLLPKQKEVWENLKNAILDVENGTAEGTSWEDFKKELADDHLVAQAV